MTATVESPTVFTKSAARVPSELGLAGLVLLIYVIIVALVPSARGLPFIADIVRSGLVTMALASGLLLIIISGGMDVSFAAIAIFSGYTAVTVLNSAGVDSLILAVVVALTAGLAWGLFNGVLVAKLKLETLMATLGSQVIVRGILLAFVGSMYISVLPNSLDSVGSAVMIRTGTSSILWLTIPVIAIVVAVGFVLRNTRFGRNIYLIGNSATSAERVGVNVSRTRIYLYVAAGAIAGLAGLLHIMVSRHGSPFELVGMEMSVIAAVVIGGATDAGGRGSMTGTVLGVILVSLVENSLVRLGVSSYWQLFVVGLVILIGVGLQSRNNNRTLKWGV